MQTNAIILESDQDAARTLLHQIESLSSIKCVVATDAEETKALLQQHQNLQYLFCVYDVSGTEEEAREQSIKDYVHQYYPHVDICSIGSIKKEEITLSNHKVLLFDRDDIADFAKASEGKRAQPEKLDFKLRSGVLKK